MQRDVAAELERADAERCRDGRVADDRGGVRGGSLEVGHRQHRVRRRLEPDQIGVRGRRTRLVVLDDLHAPWLEVAKEAGGAVVGTLCQGDRRRPGGSIVSRTVVTAAMPDGKRSALTAVERSERLLGGDAGRVLARAYENRCGSPSSYGQLAERSSGAGTARPTLPPMGVPRSAVVFRCKDVSHMSVLSG